MAEALVVVDLVLADGAVLARLARTLIDVVFAGETVETRDAGARETSQLFVASTAVDARVDFAVVAHNFAVATFPSNTIRRRFCTLAFVVAKVANAGT